MSLKERMIKAIERRECEIPDLAAAAKVKAPSVHGWVNGTSKTMKAGPAIRAAAFLRVNPLWLAEGEGEMTESPTAHELRVIPPPLALSAPSQVNQVPAIYSANVVSLPKTTPLIEELNRAASRMSERGLQILIYEAERIDKLYPQSQINPAS